MANTNPIASACAAIRVSIHTPGFSESKCLAQNFNAMCRADQLTILALVHSRAQAEQSRQSRAAGCAGHNIVAATGGK